MDVRNTPTYGTVATELVVEPKTQSRRGAVVAVALLVVGLAAVLTAGHLSSQHAAAAVHPNKMKAQQSPMLGVNEKALQLLNTTTYGLRWVIIRFNQDKTAMEPVMQGLASDDWELDWKSFTNAITFEDDTDLAPCVGLYNFPFWDDENTMGVQPLVLTYSPAGANSKEIARFGYFLGSLLLATDANKKMSAFDYVALDDPSEDYETFCRDTMQKDGVDGGKCMLETQFHNCPWDPLAEGSPCEADQCEGASFEKPDADASGTIPVACCNYVMDEFCKEADNIGTHGCHKALLRQLSKICDEPVADETPELLVTPGKVQKCEADCVQPCLFFADPADTWKKCSACETDGLAHDDKIYQCHSKALGFQWNRCCGIQDSCQAKEAQNAEMCDALEYFECSWEIHTDCDGIEVEQTAAKKIKDEQEASGKGCCESKLKGAEAGTYEIDVWGTDCGGIHTSAEDKDTKEFSFSKDMSCEAVQAAQAEAARIAAEEAEALKEAEANAAEEEEEIEERRRR